MARQDWIGKRVARWRDIGGMTQVQLADRVGVTGAHISMIERGKKPLTKRSLLIGLASALGVRVEDLTEQPHRPRTRVELAVYGTAPALRRALDDDIEGPAPDLADVAARVDRAMRARMACDYATMAALLPDVVMQSRHLTMEPATQRQGLALLVRATFTGAVALKSMGHVDLSMRLAERSEVAAAAYEEPAERAAAAFALAQVALTGGSQRRSLSVAARAADELGDVADGDDAAWYGMLRLHAALAAASLSHSDDAAGHLSEAVAAVPRAAGADGWRMEFSAANVAVWRVAVALENGEPERAPEYARRVDRSQLRTASRRARLHIDAGRGYYITDRQDRAVTQFLAADDISAQELRSRPSVRELVGQMVRDARRNGSDDLRELAVRLGIDPLDPDHDQT